MNQILSPEFGAALAAYGSALCYSAACFAVLMLVWSYIRTAKQDMEEAARIRVDVLAAVGELEMDCAEPMVSDTVRLYSGEVKHG